MKNRLTASFTYQGVRYYVHGYSKKELTDNLVTKKIEVQEHCPSSNMSVADWAMFCIEKYKVNLEPQTKEKYIRKMKHCIIEPIGHLKLQSVRPIDCQEVLNLRKNDSMAYINEVYQMLHLVFGKAYDNDLIDKDPTKDLIRPKGYKTIRRAITEKEREALYYAVEHNKRLLPYRVMLECGLRPSEAIYLKTTDIIYINNIPVIDVKGTKSKNAHRKVPIPADLLESILKAKTNDFNDYFFTTINGKKHDEQSVKRLTKALYRAMDIYLGAKVYRNQIVESVLAEDFCPYCLRKTYCTDLARNNIDVRIAQKLMGHSTIKLTSDIYTILDDEFIIEKCAKSVPKIAESLDTSR